MLVNPMGIREKLIDMFGKEKAETFLIPSAQSELPPPPSYAERISAAQVMMQQQAVEDRERQRQHELKMAMMNQQYGNVPIGATSVSSGGLSSSHHIAANTIRSSNGGPIRIEGDLFVAGTIKVQGGIAARTIIQVDDVNNGYIISIGGVTRVCGNKEDLGREIMTAFVEAQLGENK